ncbi:MAG TPA: regulatory protein RecX [Frankiaceae bacterium]|nr:regulatory protein RecX [Frankiaceae bacterium]
MPDAPPAEPPGDASRPPEPDADPASVARSICLRMLTNRPCTRAELATELRRRHVPDDAAAAVLERLDHVGLVDDREFAASWVERQRRTRGLGRRALAAELRRKGVGDEDIGEAVAVVSDDDERERAAELVARKLSSVRNLDRDKQVSRLVGMLARKGYSGGVAYAVVRAALGDLDAALLAEPDG